MHHALIKYFLLLGKNVAIQLFCVGLWGKFLEMDT